ncbi:MAG TPA: type II secretion system protein GspG [Acidobacteriota bacterium]|nr:type II secretion system protein GspG [Acidobacteriota bacterium]
MHLHVILCLLFGVAMLGGAIEDRTRGSLRDVPRQFPPYFFSVKEDGIEGEAKFRLHFSDGRVESIETLSVGFVSRLPKQATHQVAVQFAAKRFQKVFESWEALILSPFDHELSLRLELVPDLAQDEYLVSYARNGVIAELVIRSAPIEDNPGTSSGVQESETRLRIEPYLEGYLESALELFRHDTGTPLSQEIGLRSLVQDPGIEGWAGPYLREGFPIEKFQLVCDSRAACKVRWKK